MRLRDLILFAFVLSACTPHEPDPDWPVYLGDSGRRHYSALNQINRDNVRGPAAGVGLRLRRAQRDWWDDVHEPAGH